MAIDQLLDDNFFTMICLSSVTAVTVLALVKGVSGRSYNLPKGPPTVPFLGNALSLQKDDGLLEQLTALSREYGQVYSLYIGRKLHIVVNGWKAMKEVTVQTGLDFADRPESVWVRVNTKRLGLFDTLADQNWINQRKFAHTTLRGMGFGKISLEPLIQKEANLLVENLKGKQGVPMDPQVDFMVSSSNVVNKLVMDQRIDHDTHSTDEMMGYVRTVMILDDGVLFKFFPFMWHVFKYTKKWRAFTNAYYDLKAYFFHQFQMHQERLDAAKGEPEIRDFIDAYLVHRKTDPENYTLEDLHMVVICLFLGGTDTMSITLTWATIYLANHPAIQDKIHEEIEREIGDRQIALSDRSGLQYTQAALLEIQRLSTVIPVIPRQAKRDTKLAGFDVPKGTELILNFWSVHRDEAVWKDAATFKPERFLDSDGHLRDAKFESFMPFSAGKRVCIGEQLSRLELFLFFATLAQKFKFSIPPGHKPHSFRGHLTLTREPEEFKIQMTEW